MPDVFSTENLWIHYKILIGLKDQFDSSCNFFMKIGPVHWVNIIYWYFLVKAKEIVILRIQEEKYLVRHFQSNGVDNPCVDWVLSRAILFFYKNKKIYDVFYVL